MEHYYPFASPTALCRRGLTFNCYQRPNTTEQRWKFQGQEHIDDLGLNWDSFKWRNHQPDIGRFFNIDPLAEKYVYNSPYAFSENHVTTHVELEGLEKVYFMNPTANSKGFKRAYRIQRRTSGGKRFSTKLKNQSQYNVLYFRTNSQYSGVSKVVSNIDNFNQAKKDFPSTFKEVSEKGVSKAMEGGKKVILIGVDKGDTDKENSNTATYTLNHEEFHAESTLDGNNGKDKNSEDHEKYYGKKSYYSPDEDAVKTDPKYANSEAKKQYDEIDKLINDEDTRYRY